MVKMKKKIIVAVALLGLMFAATPAFAHKCYSHGFVYNAAHTKRHITVAEPPQPLQSFTAYDFPEKLVYKNLGEGAPVPVWVDQPMVSRWCPLGL